MTELFRRKVIKYFEKNNVEIDFNAFSIGGCLGRDSDNNSYWIAYLKGNATAIIVISKQGQIVDLLKKLLTQT